jgi:hypothetical protein
MARIAVSLSKSGQPCLSECGGGYEDHGKCTIVADLFFNPKVPIFVRNNPKKNSEVAIFRIRKGDHVITCDIDANEDVTTRIYKVEDFSLNLTGSDSFAKIEKVASYQQGSWTGDVTDEMIRVAQVAKGKATCYECTHMHYYKQAQSVIED